MWRDLLCIISKHGYILLILASTVKVNQTFHEYVNGVKFHMLYYSIIVFVLMAIFVVLPLRFPLKNKFSNFAHFSHLIQSIHRRVFEIDHSWSLVFGCKCRCVRFRKTSAPIALHYLKTIVWLTSQYSFVSTSKCWKMLRQMKNSVWKSSSMPFFSNQNWYIFQKESKCCNVAKIMRILYVSAAKALRALFVWNLRGIHFVWIVFASLRILIHFHSRTYI